MTNCDKGRAPGGALGGAIAIGSNGSYLIDVFEWNTSNENYGKFSRESMTLGCFPNICSENQTTEN